MPDRLAGVDPWGRAGVVSPFKTPPRAWDIGVAATSPWEISTDTTVQITSAGVSDIDLVLSFSPTSSTVGGTQRVAAFQTVSTDVWIDFTSQATLYWMASALESGSVSPNQNGKVFTSDSDSFNLPLTDSLSVSHGPRGWAIPSFDSSRYIVSVGFGLRISGWVYWGFSARCSPGQTNVRILAGSYQLARSNGSEQIGDPVADTGAKWKMPLGHQYRLAFDPEGNGTLTTI